jgi:hypothetical protein
VARRERRQIQRPGGRPRVVTATSMTGDETPPPAAPMSARSFSSRGLSRHRAVQLEGALSPTRPARLFTKRVRWAGRPVLAAHSEQDRCRANSRATLIEKIVIRNRDVVNRNHLNAARTDPIKRP